MAVDFSSEEIEQARAQVRRAEPPFVSLHAHGWLAASCAEPESFLLALGRFTEERYAPLKSHPAHGFDFVHDLVLRHVWKGREILRAYDRRTGWSILTIDALCSRSARLATAWLRRGVEKGARVAVVLPPGPELLVALIAGLRLGVLLCPIPPSGSLLTKERLLGFEPDHAHTSSLYAPLLRGAGLSETQILVDEPPQAAPGEPFASFTYPPGEPALALFSPLHGESGGLRAVPAEVLFAGMLRDLHFSFALDAGQVLAAPGSCYEQYVPGLLFTTLLGGLTYVHITIEDLRVDPRLLSAWPIHLLLVSRELRGLLGEAPRGLLPKLEAMLRDPLESTDASSWQRLREAQGMEKLPIGNLIYDSAAGGGVLFSARQRRGVLNQLLPVPGLSYVLLSPDAAAQPVIGELGTFAHSGEEAGFIVLGRSDDQYLYGGTLTPRRDGRLYPEAAALTVLSALPFVDGAAVVAVPSGDGTGRTLLVLVVLTGSEPSDRHSKERGARTELIKQRLRAQLGGSFLPDQIVMFPLIARRLVGDGTVDVERIRAEYLSGALYRKSQLALFATLHSLRAACRKTSLTRRADSLVENLVPEDAC